MGKTSKYEELSILLEEAFQKAMEKLGEEAKYVSFANFEEEVDEDD